MRARAPPQHSFQPSLSSSPASMRKYKGSQRHYSSECARTLKAKIATKRPSILPYFQPLEHINLFSCNTSGHCSRCTLRISTIPIYRMTYTNRSLKFIPLWYDLLSSTSSCLLLLWVSDVLLACSKRSNDGHALLSIAYEWGDGHDLSIAGTRKSNFWGVSPLLHHVVEYCFPTVWKYSFHVYRWRWSWSCGRRILKLEDVCFCIDSSPFPPAWDIKIRFQQRE